MSELHNGDILALEVMARRADYSNGVDIYVCRRTVGDGLSFAMPVVMQKAQSEYDVAMPMLRLKIHEAQQLMDELWQCGLRPTEGTGSAGSLAATERHLKDMRDIVVGLLRHGGIEV